MKRLMSAEHLHFILADHTLFYRFSSFLNRYRSHLVPTLIRYLEMRKAMKAIEYANSIVRTIRWPSHTDFCKFTRVQAASADVRFEDYAAREMLLLCTEALPAFITHTLIGVVADCVGRDITGQGIPVVQDLIGNLAEVFCLTDPSVHDNPIIFASEEFHRTTQYGTMYAIDRNCRFLQGPETDKDTTLRIAKAISLGQESNEILLNYRRDGTPFANLLMCAPLYDDKGIVRYFIGAQVDVTGLVKEGMGIESFRALLQKDKDEQKNLEVRSGTPRLSRAVNPNRPKETLAKLQELSMMFSQDESDIVNRNIRGGDDSTDGGSTRSGVPTSVKDRSQRKRIIGTEEMQDGIGLNFNHLNLNGSLATSSLPGVYKHYLLVRPHPSLQIIFVSPSLRIPGLLRTHLFTKLGGPSATIAALESAFRDGASVTAKVLWLPKSTYAGERGRGPAEVKPRFIRCTPLLGSDDRVGVWMVVLVPVDSEPEHRHGFGGAGSGSISLSGLGIGRRDHIADYVMDDIDGKRRYGFASSRPGSRAASVRKASSVDGDIDGGFGLKKARGVRANGLVEDERELYAEYLRGSNSPGSRVNAKMNGRSTSVSASITPRRGRKDSGAAVT
ncbi:uncharacterized protein LY89DRAFT_623352 [Mollisia scopiformis]|uniref:PAC domain-containing protein n=1 Tax=Mollisia scopiformis TaxID=149040 RepID=A0A194WWB5_MOLSC|nr:uncharacterized protein LY89DRAFT_623352 [Mollisia scopiformis]KUJ12263.1 hypothetical protein LY89DRAFT_623352 [Mollisia scopiformis]